MALSDADLATLARALVGRRDAPVSTGRSSAPADSIRCRSVAGGDDNDCYLLQLADGSKAFCKVTSKSAAGRLDPLQKYQAEAGAPTPDPRRWRIHRSHCSRVAPSTAGALRAMAAVHEHHAGPLAPRPLALGWLDSGAAARGRRGFLLMEALEMRRATAATDSALGAQLAAMHAAPPPASARGFGWEVDNTCGEGLQPNAWSDHEARVGSEDSPAGAGGGAGGADGTQSTEAWISWYSEHRLGHQISTLRDGEVDDAWRRLRPLLPALFKDLGDIRPSLLHGDLWSGNWGAAPSAAGKVVPVVFDPASYYGHNEAEFGIMHMFGSPSGAFWEVGADNAARSPLQTGYDRCSRGARGAGRPAGVLRRAAQAARLRSARAAVPRLPRAQPRQHLRGRLPRLGAALSARAGGVADVVARVYVIEATANTVNCCRAATQSIRESECWLPRAARTPPTWRTRGSRLYSRLSSTFRF